jgi:hypothetical protein
MRKVKVGFLASMVLALASAAHSPAFAQSTASAQSPALSDQPSEQRLAAGEVEVHAAVGENHHGGQVTAAVMIHARPETVWRVMHECEEAPSYIPGLKRCRRLGAAADGSWEIIEHEVKYSWLMPAIRTVLRLDYRPWTIDFKSLSGDLKAEQGSWRVTRSADSSATIVEYELYVDPGFWVPPALVRASLRKELPEALEALRARVEHLEARALARNPSPAE